VQRRDSSLVVQVAHAVVVALLTSHPLKKQILPSVLLDLLQQQIVCSGHVVVLILFDGGDDGFFGVLVEQLEELLLHLLDDGDGVRAHDDAFQLHILDLLVPFMLPDVIQLEPRLRVCVQYFLDEFFH